MRSHIERNPVTSCFRDNKTIASLHSCKLFHRPCFKLTYCDNINAQRTSLVFRFGNCYNLTLGKPNMHMPPRGTWSLFPSIQAASTTEFNKFSLEQSEETGWDRLKMMFRLTELGNISPELHIVSNTISLSLFLGAAIGGTLASRGAVEKLVRQHQANVFNHQFEGKRFFQDRLTLLLAGNAFKWAWRLALFSGTYAMIVVSATVYKNKSTIWDNILAGALCGSMWKLKMGLRATAVGGGLGGMLGLFAGCLSACALWLSGTTIEEMRYWHHDYWEREYRRQAKLRKQKDATQENELLAIEHDERLLEKKIHLP